MGGKGKVEYHSTATDQHVGESEMERFFFLVSDTRGGCDYSVVRSVRLESSGEILGAN